jgi:heme/copper-type cytochrome/quinol oxidase subunit 4
MQMSCQENNVLLFLILLIALLQKLRDFFFFLHHSVDYATLENWKAAVQRIALLLFPTVLHGMLSVLGPGLLSVCVLVFGHQVRNCRYSRHVAELPVYLR